MRQLFTILVANSELNYNNINIYIIIMDKEYILKCNIENKITKQDEEEEIKPQKDKVENLDLDNSGYKPKYRKRRYNEIFHIK